MVAGGDSGRVAGTPPDTMIGAATSDFFFFDVEFDAAEFIAALASGSLRFDDADDEAAAAAATVDWTIIQSHCH